VTEVSVLVAVADVMVVVCVTDVCVVVCVADVCVTVRVADVNVAVDVTVAGNVKTSAKSMALVSPPCAGLPQTCSVPSAVFKAAKTPAFEKTWCTFVKSMSVQGAPVTS